MNETKGTTKCKRPKMRSHRGRTWDWCPVILHSGTKIDGYYDTSWGEYFYFTLNNQWYKGKIATFDTGGSNGHINVDLRTKQS